MKIFAVQGLPEQLVSDNGSHLISEEFKEFCKFRGINNCYVTPYHPQVNGQAERFIQTFKKCKNKMAKNSKNIDYNFNSFLLTCRVTVHATTNVAPSQLLLGRKLRTRLDLIHPRVRQNVNNNQSHAAVQERVHESQKKQEAYHDRTAKIREFEVEELVWARNCSNKGHEFVHAKVHHKISPLSYRVLCNVALTSWAPYYKCVNLLC